MFVKKYKDPLLVFSFVFILSLFLFGGVLGSGYILDDNSVIKNREELRGPAVIYKAFFMPWHQNQPWAGNYRPLTLLSYSGTLLFSESTAAMRLVNIVVHSANAVLVFALALLFFSKKTSYIAAIGFSILPINAGTVVSMVGRSDLLGVFFLLLSLLFFYKEKRFLSVLSFFLALLAKDFSVLLLPVVVLLSWFSKSYSLKATVKTTFHYVFALAPYFLLRYLALGGYAVGSRGSVDPVIGPLAFVGLKERIMSGFVYFYLYLRKTFLPFGLSPDYSFNQIPVPNYLNPGLIIGFILLALVLFLFFKNKSQKVRVPVILFLVSFGVISNTLFVTTGVFAERWWYFPSIGLVLFVLALLDYLPHGKKFILPVVAATGVFYLFISFGQARIWTDGRKLVVSASKNSPNSAWARANLAAVYFKEKEFELAGKEVEKSLEIYKDYPFALNIYAKLKWREEKLEESESAFLSAIGNDVNKRNHRDLYRALAILKLEKKDYDEALSYIRRAVGSTTYGDIEKTVYLDNLLLSYIESETKNKTRSLSESETNIIKSFIVHIRGF
ncbi:MAG: hypothetical protein HYT63_02545 [Candidatus Yanofskybacteria bacterium]|nr:hypothetical protein [Candidatus Yanofskybacteria bacterium]